MTLLKTFTKPILGVVVIGRNEGARLVKSLESMQSCGFPIIYVDSGSKDASLSVADKLASLVHTLDPSKAFSAARARNEGFAIVTHKFPSIKYIQFIDGDCYLCDGWIENAIKALDQNEQRAAVVGHLIERAPEASVYNKLCSLEWKSPTGDMVNFGALGGISIIRTDIFQQLNGFKEDVIAGEDSELGVRISLLGYKITKLDQNMATHDANMTKFSQWWKRSVRAGHAIGQRADLNGDSIAKDCVKERKSTIVWGILLPLLVALLFIPTEGFSLFLLMAYFLLLVKVLHYRLKQDETFVDAAIYAFFVTLAKIANGIGLLKYYWNRRDKQYKIIEYK